MAVVRRFQMSSFVGEPTDLGPLADAKLSKETADRLAAETSRVPSPRHPHDRPIANRPVYTLDDLSPEMQMVVLRNCRKRHTSVDQVVIVNPRRVLLP